MPEKIKIKKSEIDELYDIEDDSNVITSDAHKVIVPESNAQVDFEEYTEAKDKEDDKKWRSDVEEE